VGHRAEGDAGDDRKRRALLVMGRRPYRTAI
jgi:hypothetical protein